MHHLRYSLRSLRKSPGFSLVAIAVLAMGIGSNLAVFSLIDSLFLKPLPVDRPSELVRISSIDRQGRSAPLTSQVLDELRGEPMLQGLCAFATPPVTTRIDGALSTTQTITMSGGCFPALGLRTQIGRPFTAGEDRRGIERIAVLTDSLWRSAFAASPAVLGRTIEVEGQPVRIIGVTAAPFTGLHPGARPGLILPLEQTPLDFVPNPNRPVYFWVDILARRAPAVSVSQVQARLGVMQQQLLEQSVPMRYNEAQRRDYFARRIVALSTGPGADSHLKERFGDPLWTILAICGAVLLIACVNLTTLLLARGLRRQKEIAVRLELGAGRASVARLVALDGALLVFLGTVAGVLLSRAIIRLVMVQAADLFTIDVNPLPDGCTVAFLAAIVLLTAAILTAVPVWQSGRLVVPGARGMVGAGTRSQKILLAVQVALTLALVSASGLFTSSMRRLDELNLGVKTAGVAEAMLAPMPGAGRSAPRAPYYRSLLRQVAELPGVSATALSDFTPFWTATHADSVTTLEGGASRNDVHAQTIAATDGFFAALGIPLVAGEAFPSAGQEPAEPVAVVSQSLANLLGGRQLIGRHIRVGDSGPYQRLQVIGIAGDAQLALEDPTDTHPLAVYVDLWQFADGRRPPTLLVKGGAAAELRRAVQAGGRDYIQHFVTMEGQKAQALIENQWLAWLSAAFGVLALALAATGLFGLLSYHVASRTSEIGLRMALGAERGAIHALVLRQILPVMAVGMAAGLALALAMARLLASMIFGVSVYDQRLLAASALVLVATALGAAWLPARKAASIDPLAALRHD